MISVAGVPAVGKSSLVKRLGELLEWETLMERVPSPEFLKEYYENPELKAFQFQILMMKNRFHDIKYGLTHTGVILDQPLTADFEAFARTNFEEGSMSDNDWEIYSDLFSEMMEEAREREGGRGRKVGDLNIILTSSLDNIQNNIKKRGRPAEQFEVGDSKYHYFEKLNNNFYKYADTYSEKYNSPELVIDVSNIDFENNEEDRKFVLTTIVNKLNELELITDEELEVFSKRI